MPIPFKSEPRTQNPELSPEVAAARAFLYQFLSRAFDYPDQVNWRWLSDEKTHGVLVSAARLLGTGEQARGLLPHLKPESFEAFAFQYVSAFGHAARGPFPLNEIEYGDLKADPLFQPHRLADLSAFYRAFGLSLNEDADERHDHLSMELEFMSVLTMKEAYANEKMPGGEQLDLCRDAQKKFLREHLGSWTPAFCRRLARSWKGGILEALAELLRKFIEQECATLEIRGGSEDLLLRPIDDSVEKLCESCGLSSLPPGAMPMTEK